MELFYQIFLLLDGLRAPSALDSFSVRDLKTQQHGCSFHRLCFCMSEVISSFKSLRAGSHVFAILVLLLYVILHTMWSGKSLKLLCIIPFCMLGLSAISMMFVKIMLAVCMLVGVVV